MTDREFAQARTVTREERENPEELFRLIIEGNRQGIGREEMIDRLVHDFPWLTRENMGVLVDCARAPGIVGPGGELLS